MILRNVTDEDLPIFFELQRDPEAQRMAAFASRERDAFMTHWRTNALRSENVTRTIVMGGVVVGHIGSWEQDAMRLEPTRPLHAWVALNNLASIRVLEKCGFRALRNENPHHPDGVAEALMRLGST